MKRRFVSLLTAFALCLTLIPTAAFAVDEENGEDTSPCVCETVCTEESMNPDCTVCGAEDARPEDCCAPKTADEADSTPSPEEEPVPAPGGTDEPQPGEEQPDEEQPDAPAEGEASDAPTEVEEPSVPTDDELINAAATEESPAAAQAADGIRVQAASGTLTLGSTVLDITQNSISSTYETTGGFKYDADTNTLTLRNYRIDTYTTVRSDQLPGIFRYYNVFLDSRNVGTLNIVLEGSNYIGDSSSLKYTSASSDLDTPRCLGIWGNTVRFSGSGSLTIEAQTFPIQSGGIETSGSVKLTLRSWMKGTVTQSMTVGAGTRVTAEAQGNNLDFYALSVKNNLTVNGTLDATTKGCIYQSDYPVALLVGGTLRVVGGTVTATSDGRNSNDGCQGYGIKANALEIGSGGSVKAYSNGYSTKTNQYDGKEAIYVSSNLTVDLGGYLYAKTQNPILSNENENGALKVNGSWNLSGTNGDMTYTTAVITKPVNGSIYENVILGENVAPEKEVEISGIRNAMLVLSYYKGQNNEGKTWYYRNADRPGDTDLIRQNIYSYSSSSTQQELNLKEGFSRVLAPDYNNYYGIDVREGTHTIVLDGLAITRDHTFLTVRSGATLNLKLTGNSYLKSDSAPAIYVEQGGTLNLIGEGMAKSSLALMGGLTAESGATVNFKDCAVYTAGKTIGGTGANISIENSWISASFAGNLRVTRSTLEGKHSGGTVKIDRGSNANLTDVSGKAITGVTDHSGNAVYRTKVELEDMNQSRNLMIISYRTDAASDTMRSTFYPLVTQLRVNVPNTVNDDVIKDLTMLVGSNTVYLWLPTGTKIMSVEGFQDDGSSPVGFIHDPQKDAPIVTTADNNASGKMILLNLLLASGVLAFRGTPGGDNTALCAGYLGDSAKDTWIDYHPEKDVKLQADWKFITDFGIRMLMGGEAEVKLNGLDLSGPNKRMELDDRSKLSIVLMENTESVMRSNEGSTDAVWTLKDSGSLTIKGQSGGEKLTLRGDHAMDGSTSASLTFNGITLINNCTNKPETTLGKLTISNSLVFGLGTINCANVVINGGSVDLDVPVDTVVKDSSGNELKKVTLTLSEKNTAVEDVTLSGLPANATFDDSHIISDGGGKIYLWIPKDAEVETVTVGGNKYYPKSDGSMTIGDVPEFTSPAEDVSCVVESIDDMTLTVEVVGTPAPALQWQVSRDDGKTWENIDGATEVTYRASLPLTLHGAKFRCAATNKDGTTYSHTFTAYYCPAVLRGAASPMRGNGDFIQGEIATIIAGFYDNNNNNTWYPVSALTGVTAEYRWDICGNNTPSEEEWAKIPPAGESYPITITDEMDYQFVRIHVTLTYPDNTVKTVIGFRRLYVCATPVVTEQPQSVSAAVGDSVTFSAKLIEQYLNTLEYQWQISTDGGQSWTDIEGASGISHTEGYWSYIPSYTITSVTAAQSGQLFRCVLWNTNNHTGSERVSTPPVYSEPATLTVTGGVSITQQPQDAAVTYGTDAVFGVTAAVDSGELRYQWQVKTASDGVFADIEGATESRYTVSAPTVAMSGWQYRCIVTGESDTAYSAAAALTVSPKVLHSSDLTYTGPITKAYDASTNAPDGLVVSVKPASLVGSDTLTVTGTLAYNSPNVDKADQITFTPNAITTGNYALAASEVLVIHGAAITQAAPSYTVPTGLTARYGQALGEIVLPTGWSWMNSAQTVGDASATPRAFKAKFTPQDSINYQTVENIDIVVTVGKADGGSLETFPLTQKYSDTGDHTYAPDWSRLPAGQVWSYHSESNPALAKLNFAADGSSLTYAIPRGKSAGDKFTLMLKASCSNYEDFTITLELTLTEKNDQTALTITGGTTVVYGQTLVLGTTGGSGKGQVTYRVANNSGEAVIDVVSGVLTPIKAGKVAVTATKAGDDSYNAVTSVPVEITITKATPTGAPKYSVTTSSGKQLSDAGLTVEGSTFSVPGMVKWVDANGKELPASTEVAANTAYRWVFTPSDSNNYNTIDGSVTLYRVSSGGSSSGSSTTTKTDTTNPDGSTTKTETKADGTVTETTTNKDGSTTKTETKKDGSSVTDSKAANGSTGTVKTDADGKTEADAKISTKAVEDAKKSGEAVKVPTEVKAGEDSNSAPTVKIELPRNAGETKIEIPVEDVNSGTVAIIVHEDGTEEIVKDSLPTESGVQLTVDGNTTVKIIDNAKDFIDTKDHWAEDAIDFVSARGLVSGVSATMYAPDTSTTRSQLWTILARQNGADLTGGNTWYEKAQAWSMASGISDGSNPNGTITRAQMVTMLWRAAGSPAAQSGTAFTDVAADNYYAQAVAWAVEHGITTGVGNGKFDPNGTCTRAQIATFLMRSYQNK